MFIGARLLSGAEVYVLFLPAWSGDPHRGTLLLRCPWTRHKLPGIFANAFLHPCFLCTEHQFPAEGKSNDPLIVPNQSVAWHHQMWKRRKNRDDCFSEHACRLPVRPLCLARSHGCLNYFLPTSISSRFRWVLKAFRTISSSLIRFVIMLWGVIFKLKEDGRM